MLKLKGVPTSEGIADGRIFMIKSQDTPPTKKNVDDIDKEIYRLKATIEKVKLNLVHLYEKTKPQTGEDTASIFAIHRMMLEDPDFVEEIVKEIKNEKICAEYAVYTAGKRMAAMFSAMDNEYMKARASDVQDLSRSIADCLSDKECDILEDIRELVVVATDDLLPSQTVQLDKSKVAAFVTKAGSYNSHASILARSLGIPAISALGDDFAALQNGMYVVVDAQNGVVLCDPDEESLSIYSDKVAQLYGEKQELMHLVHRPAHTRDGMKIQLCANIAHPEEAFYAKESGAEGIGLFRSEFLYMDSDTLPNEDIQYDAYKKALEIMYPHKVIVRTMDIGADKRVPAFPMERELNPAMGYRGVRVSVNNESLFLPQLRALLRASVHGNLSIMFPMITNVDEVKQAKAMLQEAGEQLSNEGITYNADIDVGIMIETPAAVVMADKLAEEVDFFSIGTNDLTQYTMAADRMNGKVDYLLEMGTEAILRMIQHVAGVAHRKGIWVGICGEAACDVKLLPHYIAMEIDELSMSAPEIVKIKKEMSKLHSKQCEIINEKLWT